MASNIKTIHDSPTSRMDNGMCPNAHTCWPNIWNSYNLIHPPSCAVLFRRIAMICVLTIRTVNSVLVIASRVHHPVNLVVSIILAVLGFFFIAWCLARIGDMEGERPVFGTNWGRWHFDAFLGLMFIVHVGFLGGFFVGMSWAVFQGLWLGCWLAIFGVAWVATWHPEPVSAV